MKSFHKLLLLFLGIPILVVVFTVLIFIILSKPFSTLSSVLFIEGLLIIVISGIGGVDFGEARLYSSPYFIHSAAYRDMIHIERKNRRREHFSLMLLGFILGFIIILLAYIINRISGL